MKLKVIIVGCMLLLLAPLQMWAQPKARAARNKQREVPENGMSVRAQTRFPRAKVLPTDLVWMREVYRTVDLTKNNNGALYFPVEPVGNRMNLFSTIFKLLGRKKINAYEYQLDGTERLTKDNRVNFMDVLDRFQIYYERREVEGRKDSALVIENSDIPSADVKSYFIKEVWYFDRQTSTYGSAVTALCPVLHRSEEFSSEIVKLPMFWIDYQELAPYMSDTKVMTSNLNNVPNSTLDDFFLSRKYEGDIYKTTNLQNQTLAQYCPNDSVMDAERKRIEQELVLVESHLFGTELPDEEVEKADEELEEGEEAEDAEAAEEETKVVANSKKASVANSKKPASNSKKAAVSSRNSKKSKSSGKQKSEKVKESRPKGGGSSAPKASVRRQRR